MNVASPSVAFQRTVLSHTVTQEISRPSPAESQGRVDMGFLTLSTRSKALTGNVGLISETNGFQSQVMVT
jgi:hypothetical protein